MRDFSFRLSRKAIPAGEMRLVFVNAGSVTHDWVVPARKGLRSARASHVYVTTLGGDVYRFAAAS
jgi:hypothetical protein